MILFSIIGALIGAGFASGQEIYLFFYRYGINGIYGLVLCSALIGYVIYKTFLIIYNKSNSKTKEGLKEINNYQDFLDKIFHGRIANNSKKYFNISYISSMIINIFLLITFFIMISGFGTYFEQEFNVNNIIGAIILAIICFFIFLTDVSGVTKVNSIVVPILIGIILIIGINNLISLQTLEEEENINSFIQKEIGINETNKNSLKMIINKINNNWIVQSIIYCSYNMILLIPVLINLKQYIKSKKQIIKISLLSSIIVFILAMSIYLLLLNIDVDISKLEMPAVYAISKNFPIFKPIYGIVILLSIFTTAISIGISFLENITKNKKSFTQIAGIMCITSVLISNIGFSNLVKMLFPVFGYLGLIQIMMILGT